VLCGEQIENVIGEVSKKDYVESIWLDIEGAIEDIADEYDT
jgi:streptomycin 3"-adenylyltransferase